jgi:chemotaxis protein methyltransferase CheR
VPALDPDIKEEDLFAIGHIIAEVTGLAYPPSRWNEMRRGVFAACREVGREDPSSCIAWVRSAAEDPGVVEYLVRHLTVGETYFFRDKRLFELLGTDLLPSLIRERKGSSRYIRLWSAACSTGEEAYSLAILLLTLIQVPGEWDIRIFATDINPKALERARTGVYSSWSFRDVLPVAMARFFSETKDGHFVIDPAVRELVTFKRQNLAKDHFPLMQTGAAGMDLILCRNVLMYLTPGNAANVTAHLAASLIEGGYLIVSPQEVSLSSFPTLSLEERGGVLIYQKGGINEVRTVDTSESKFPTLPARDVDITQAQDPIEDLWVQRLPDGVVEDSSSGVSSTNDLTPVPGLSSQVCPPDEVLLACALANQGMVSDALLCCERALLRDPLNPRVHLIRASILQESGDLSAAARAFRQAIFADPDFVPAHIALARLSALQGKSKDAKRHLGNVISALATVPDDGAVEGMDGMQAGQVRALVRSLGTGL